MFIARNLHWFDLYTLLSLSLQFRPFDTIITINILYQKVKKSEETKILGENQHLWCFDE